MARLTYQPFGFGSSQSGIAIGPILFIIAILAILAAAIAAGSGSFTTTTSSESAKTIASGLIQVGENLKIGMDRLTIENGATATGPTAFVIGSAATTSQYDLFSPTGGGIAPPSTSLAAAPNYDQWHYLTGAWPGVGTGTSMDWFAALNITGDVCNQVNNRVGVASTISTNLIAYDVFAGQPPAGVGTNVAGVASVPVELSGKTLGCFGDKTSGDYYFYEIIFIQ